MLVTDGRTETVAKEVAVALGGKGGGRGGTMQGKVQALTPHGLAAAETALREGLQKTS